MSGRFSCARDSRARDEAVHATASIVRRWIIVEQPGPWGRDAVVESRLPEATSATLMQRARDLAARAILVRRYGGEEAVDGRRTCFVAHTAPGNSWIESFEFERPAELLDRDLTPLRAGGSVGGRRLDTPLYLVCTNGSHDVCCAEYGRPLAAALDAARPALTWECSHIGGDRFAANLVCFPHGVYFGRLEPDDGVRIADAYEDGHLVLDRFRGRSCYSFLVQAADYFVRRERCLTAVEAIAFESVERLDANDTDVFEVTFTTPAGDRFVATVSRHLDPTPQQMTCSATAAGHPPRYDLLELVG